MPLPTYVQWIQYTQTQSAEPSPAQPNPTGQDEPVKTGIMGLAW
jgi:hypothetical protein